MTVAVSGESITFNDSTVQNTAPKVGMVNRLINGAMVIDQRDAGAAVTPASSAYTLDRWSVVISVGSKFSVQQNAGSLSAANRPVGFTNYLGATSLAATAVGASDYYQINQSIEGFNFADLNWGTANAQPVTLSFWVRSSLTGAFGGALLNAAENRSYPYSYTISAANTWEQKTVTIAGDTTGTWVGATNGTGVQVRFSLGMGSTYTTTANAWAAGVFGAPTGSTNVVSTNGATFYITGVQLEKGSTATDFDYQQYGTELALCQRYFYQWSAANGASAIVGSGQAFGASAAYIVMKTPVTMRTTPTTFSFVGTFGSNNAAGGGLAVTAISLVGGWANENMLTLESSVSTGWVAGNAVLMSAGSDATCRLNFSAEL